MSAGAVVSPRKNQEQNGRRDAPLEIGISEQSYASALVAKTGYIFILWLRTHQLTPSLNASRRRWMKPTATASTAWCCLARARGEARPDSDYDIAVFLKDPDSFWKESGRLAEIETDILYETGAIINALPFLAGAYRDRTPLMHEVRREGLDL
jgi:hypothetical protein